MPRGDGTGPMGMGPITGRGAGICGGYAVPNYMNPGIGYGMGFGRGRGFRPMFYNTGMMRWTHPVYPVYGGTLKPEADEKEYLNNQAELLTSQLEHVKKRLEVLNGEID